jgi:hydrogenase maturation factor
MKSTPHSGHQDRRYLAEVAPGDQMVVHGEIGREGWLFQAVEHETGLEAGAKQDKQWAVKDEMRPGLIAHGRAGRH